MTVTSPLLGLNTEAAAEYIDKAPATLRYWRVRNEGPAWYKAGGRNVYYREADLDKWLEAQYQSSVKTAS